MVAEVSLSIPGGVDAPSQARTALRALHPELRPDTVQIVTLLVSELVTNAIRHGAAESVALHAQVLAGCVRVDVTDEGPGFTSGPNPEIPDAQGGWGLFLVDQLANRWGVQDEGKAGTHVWLEVDR